MPLDIFPVEGPWDGKLAVCMRPRPGNFLDDDIRDLKSNGFGTLVSAITGRELEQLHLTSVPEICARHEVDWVHFPIGNLQVPAFEVAMPALRGWVNRLESGGGIAVHCFGSVGRSPMLAASMLALRGIDPVEAWNRVETSRGREVPDTLEQRRWVDRLVVTLQGLSPK